MFQILLIFRNACQRCCNLLSFKDTYLAVNYKIKKVGKGGVLFNTTHTSHNIRIIMVLITPQVGHE